MLQGLDNNTSNVGNEGKYDIMDNIKKSRQVTIEDIGEEEDDVDDDEDTNSVDIDDDSDDDTDDDWNTGTSTNGMVNSGMIFILFVERKFLIRILFLSQ